MTSSRSKKAPAGFLRGYVIVPLMTPFTADGALDQGAVQRLIDHVIHGGCQGILVGGTIGEAASMSLSVRQTLIEIAVQHAAGRARIFAGIGDNSWEDSILLAQRAFAAGADAVVAHLPSYFQVGEAEMEAYFSGLADRMEGPMYIYNIPQTTRLSVPLEVLLRLSRHRRTAGIMDSESDAARQRQVAQIFAERQNFAVYCGSIPFTAAAMRAGADGFVPSAGNLAPRVARAVMDRWVANDEHGAVRLQERLNAVSAIYQDGRTLPHSLCAMKAALSIMGLCSHHMLPPLRPCTKAEMMVLQQLMRREELVA